MKNIFLTIISLLFLNACSEEKKQDKTEKQPIIVQETVQENIEPADKSPEENSAESIVPDNTPQESQTLNQEPLQEEQAKPDIKPTKVSFLVDDSDMVLGNRESTVVLVEYFSPTCPHCAYYHKTIFPELKKKYIDTNKVAYITREFIATKQDLDAAILARCKGDINNFIKFHEIILEQQDKWAYSNKYRELLTDIGQLGGITPEEYKKCLSDDNITEILIANTNFVARTPKFIGTPSFFVNGVQTENYSIASISTAIDKAIEEKKEEAKNETNL
ncbi:MAG TPA: DsbA family protein [Rickettsia endosymbiont of Pyrocoelia pectoralis]|nr:DsbA family protein [Rickettsia endosymbiont of Pyrocoelia pectoralis]